MISVMRGVRRACSIKPNMCGHVFTPIYGCGAEGMTLLNSCLCAKELGLCWNFEFCGKQLNSVGPWPYKLWLNACQGIDGDLV